jgi:hypothetical protein
MPDGTQQREDRPDHHQDDPDRPQNRDREREPHHQEDNPQNDYAASCTRRLAVSHRPYDTAIRADS